MTVPAPAGDSGGITGTPAVLPLARLAAHPRNPRGDLGDLAELTASVSAHGVFEPLVVVSAAAYAAAAGADGDPERPAGRCTHVIVMGHRRAAAARAAGLADVPVVVRDDLAGAPALAAMIAENLHREALAPLAEAGAMAELARRGWPQRKIAAEVGCSQAHVSKRLALLQLPEPARHALAGGKLTVDGALELHKIAAETGPDSTGIISKAVTDIAAGYPAASAISTARQEARRAAAARKTREDLQARGVQIITDAQRGTMGWPRVRDHDTGPHEKAGCLAAIIGWSGHPEWACVNPAGHPDSETSPADRARARESEDEREIRKAARARDAACVTIAAGPLPGLADLARLLAATLLGGAGHSESLRLACRWLRDAGIAPPGADHYRWRDQLAAAGDHAGLARYAHAYALAADELHVRARYHAWGDRHAAHLARLAAAAGYQPGGWEQARLEEARRAAGARGSLSCLECGCSCADQPAGCDVRFDRDADEPVYQCAWDCRRHCARRDAGSREPADHDDDAAGPPDDLPDAGALATGPLTAADGGATGQEGQRPGRDAGDIPAADGTASAAPGGTLWTPELRAALEGLMPGTARRA